MTNCLCTIHRYHVAHICSCGLIYAHSQGACDTHRSHEACVDIDPARVNCQAKDKEELARTVFNDAVVEGSVQSQPGFPIVYRAFAEMERPHPYSVKE